MKDLTGEKFGRLTVKGFFGKTPCGNKQWLCICDCGRETVVSQGNLGRCTFSCGCFKRDSTIKRNTKHGLSGGWRTETRLYKIWICMRDRCRNTNHKDYGYYGGRGIHVCDEWNNYKAFHDWAMSSGYDERLTIDREDNNGNYCPENCRWATRKVQAYNRRNTRLITCEGEIKSVNEWAEKLGVKPDSLHMRLHRGWSEEDTIRKPFKDWRSHTS